ncbi:hypothetical protein C1646_365096 [Rhizophagus diaphanus]|nr:hypothetical protein C1646_365096 [Rhizophagus diaphanus] [Rhizophagus sp. MUCL 43196]
MTMDCHHCGNFGHKKYECTSKCRVGCKWCDKPPSRRQITRNSIEMQRQHSTVNIQRNQGSTSINNGQLSLPQQYSQNTNDVRFSYNGSQGHLQQNLTGNVGNVGNVQQHVPNNIQQVSANLGNLGNLQHHLTNNMQNVQVNGLYFRNL